MVNFQFLTKTLQYIALVLLFATAISASIVNNEGMMNFEADSSSQTPLGFMMKGLTNHDNQSWCSQNQLWFFSDEFFIWFFVKETNKS